MFRFSNFKIVFKRDLTYYHAYRLDNAITKFPSRTVRCMILHGLPVRDSRALPRSRLAPFQTLFDPHASPPPGKAWSTWCAQTNGFPWECGLLHLNRARMFCDLNKQRVYSRSMNGLGTEKLTWHCRILRGCLTRTKRQVKPSNYRCSEVYRLNNGWRGRERKLTLLILHKVCERYVAKYLTLILNAYNSMAMVAVPARIELYISMYVANARRTLKRALHLWYIDSRYINV